MLKSITVINHLGESLKMDIRRPDVSGFYVKKIEGLGPVKANINITERTTIDGGQYTSARADSRNIVITLGFLFTHDIESVRHKSYKYFPLKRRVTLIIETDTRTCETYGYVESNEPGIFDKEEGTVISVLCPDSYFYSSGDGSKTVTVFSGVEPMFEFPFSCECVEASDTPEESFIEFGEIRRLGMNNVRYFGDMEVGMTIHIHIVGDVSNITIYNETSGERMKINTDRITTLTGKEVGAGDEIIICTVKGEKSVQLLREGVWYNILNCLDKRSNWLQLLPGDNVLAYTVESGEQNIQFSIENRMTYEGV